MGHCRIREVLNPMIRFRAITHAYYRGAVGAMICYDITKE
jgi:GTPase SAR1 family protein